MSQANVELIKRAVAAINARDLDGYLAYCTADIELQSGGGSRISRMSVPTSESRSNEWRQFLQAGCSPS
jgi:hypothetical protein